LPHWSLLPWGTFTPILVFLLSMFFFVFELEGSAGRAKQTDTQTNEQDSKYDSLKLKTATQLEL